MRGAPLVVAYIGLFEQERAALIELADQAPSVVDGAEALAFEVGDALLGYIDPEFAGHAFEDLGFKGLGIEPWIGLEAEAVAGALRGFDDAVELIEEGVGQGADDFSGAFGVALLTLLAMTLEAGVVEEALQTGSFRLLAFCAQRAVVYGDEAGDVAVFGFYDELGGGEARAGLVQAILHGVGGVPGRFDLGLQDALHQGLRFFVGKGSWGLGGLQRGRDGKGQEQSSCGEWIAVQSEKLG